MKTKQMLSDLISALCGDEWEEAKEITERISATGDAEAIRKAELINSYI